MAEVLRTACTRDCPDACGILATVEDGRVTQLQGDPEHPVTRGFLCYRTNRFLERQYDPDRLTTPLVRVEGELLPTSWDAALDLVADRMLRFREESGPASIFHYKSGGSLGLVKHLAEHFFEQFGPVSIKRGDICSGAGEAAQELDFGVSESSDLFDLLNARTIVLWGKNPYVSNVHLLPVLRDAKKAGAKIVLVDPVAHRTDTLADLVIRPRPGSDFGLAMAVARRLFERDWVDVDAPSFCDHFDAHREFVHSRSIEEWLAESGVPRVELEQLTELYRANGPATILVGWGMQRRANGAATVRALDALGAISGNLGIPGGGVSFYFGRRTPFDVSFIRGLEVAPRSVPEPLLGEGLLAADDPPVRMVWVTCGNPVAMLPDSRKVAEALRSRELTVVVDSFLTDTARCADVVLPTATMLEDDDVVGAYGHHWMSLVEPVVAAPPEVRTDLEIVQALAQRVGLGDKLAGSAEDWKRRLLARVAPAGASHDALREAHVRNPEAARILFEGRRFPTETGKVNLLHEAPVSVPAPSAEFPLYLMSIATEKSQASQTTAAFQDGPAEARVHPAAANGFADGELVTIESELGSLPVRLRHDSRQRRDVVLVPKGGWLHADRCANALVRAVPTDLGDGAAYYDECVRLVPRVS